MAERGATLDLSQTVSKLLLKSFNRFAEPLDTFTELVSSHPILSHHGNEALLIHIHLLCNRSKICRI